MNLYVSHHGNDAWSGKKAGPDRSKRDGPFATLGRARDAIRALKQKGSLPAGGVTVWIREGAYPQTQTFELTKEDSGTKSSPIVYRAYRKEEVRLTGGKEVGGFLPVMDSAILDRLDEAGRGKILQTDLQAQGITDFGKISGRGFGRAIQPSGLELFFQDKPMQLARCPNGDWAKIAAAPAGPQGGKFAYEGDRPGRWKDTGDIWIHGYWTYDWADTYEKVRSIDTEKREIATYEPHGAYGYTPGKRWYALNILEELDEPGEWYLDRNTGILYFWPPAPVDQGKVVVSLLEKPLISLRDTSHITLWGLTLECARGHGIEISGGSHNLVAGCTLRNIGDAAVNIEGGIANGVVGCDIYETGEGGVILSGGDRKTLTPGKNYAVNNYIIRFNRWAKTYRPAVLVNGVGNRVAHNLMHDAPHNAILMGGNDNIIEFNEIYDVCKETGDAGAFYIGRDLTQRGNIVRYNYFHHLRAGGLEGQQGFTEVMAVYLDDCLCGTLVYGNIFYKAGRAMMIGGGRDNTVENNIFIDCYPAVHVDARGTGWAKFWFDGSDPFLMDGLKAVSFNKPPYSVRYPELADILEDEPAVPKGNRIIRNIRSGGRWIDLLDGLTDKIVTIKDNLLEGDPGFADPEKEDFRLKKNSPAWKLGFRRIPIEKIGLYQDRYRTALPVPGDGTHTPRRTKPMSAPEPRPVPRKDAFFGLHFDLHPQKTDTSLGADITEENIARLLNRVKPDYVQYDCKGHAGYTGYPTKIGWPSPGIVKDSLAIWRKVAREHGVGLFIHYSGVWDSVAVEHHPEWARIDAAGNRDPNNTSTFGPYADELLIPQLKEVTSAYELDGMWVDGECWAAQIDYSPAALEQWKKETGYPDAPKDRSDPRWLEWKMFHRHKFEKYLSHWVDALHEFNPKLQITSNWMYTTFAPKPVAAKLDFLSGDYSPTLSVDRARVEARYLANTGMPWDLMAWGFNWGHDIGQSLKPAVHLQQEASVVLMQGGGFQIYYNPTRSGYLVDEIIETAGQAADFCRSRQKVSHKSTSVPQVALLLSTETQFDRSDAVFTPYGCMDELEGALHALLELHYSVDILAEHQLQPHLSEFPLVVIPDSYKLSEDFKQALLKYINDGGSLLLMGEKCARLFEPLLGVNLEGEPQQTGAEIKSPLGVVNSNGVWQKVIPTTAEAVGFRYPTRDTRKDGEIAATLTGFGKGKIGAIYGPLALAYFRTHHPALRAFIGDLAKKLFSEPAVEIDAPSFVDIALRRTQDGKLSLHLLNLAETQRADRFFSTDSVPLIGPIAVKMKVEQKPQQVFWSPKGDSPQWSWSDGTLTITISSLHIHGAVVVE